ncbi:MAG: glutamate--tRNA ligase [Lysobacterales bacterium CG17_big_fil_post_rev_8_21_14_2_50_64_11]|nr:MAG: glutamate--tRNA ligase [Xanthomonadales bacterium CG17_big_fil_post_rev_8_21_14_2_50_64_11]PIX60803.1 MAG: glutamate--tRNA ligase [Xanthomonadales bacterium CG_4_10_14_3_um_filter_64_11]
MTCRTRFAPSPTGFLHIGGARTALYCWLEARRRGGEFILRVEDTDRERSTEAAVQAIVDGMQWLGLSHDEGPFYQTLRVERYREVAAQLVKAGKAYYAYETREQLDAMREQAMAAGLKPRYNGYYRERNEPMRDDPNRVIRFKNPQGGSVVFNDKVKGRVEWSNDELDDLVILRSDNWPTYNFAVVVDDIDMRITDVIRGDDHVANTPRQINIYQALAAPVPAFAHLPMILGPDGAKLSKRHGAVSVMQYREDGFLPQALLNYLVRLGWSHGDQEIFSREEMIALFQIEDVNHSASRFDVEKLSWLNQQYFKQSDPAQIAPELEWHLRRIGIDPASGPAAADVVVALADRVKTLADMAERARVWYQPLTHYDAAAASKHLQAAALPALQQVHDHLAGMREWSPAAIHDALEACAKSLDLGLGKVAQPLRVAITGSQVSPSIDHTIYLAGRSEALNRIDAALARIRDGAA